MASNKKYWKSVEELNEGSLLNTELKFNEFVEEIPVDEFLGDKEKLESSSTSRRDFLKYVGFTTAAASLAACEGPVVKSIPYVVKPDFGTPGVADYYATTIADGFDFANVVVKVREGRPIKLDPNKEANGCTNARVQASVLSLYDNRRLKEPKLNGSAISWEDADKQIIAKLNELKEAGETIAILTGTHASPSTNQLIQSFKEKYGNVRVVTYDAVSESAVLDALEEGYGVRALPNYKFEDAEVIVSVGADFIADWQGGGFEGAYAKGRIPKNGKMSRHVQFESNMTLSGANADKRVPVKPSEQILVLTKLYNAIVKGIATRESSPINNAVLRVADELQKAGSKAVVVTGIQDKNAQLLAFAINEKLGSKILDTANTRNIRQGNDAEVNTLIKDMNAGKIGAVIIQQSNPVYTLPNSEEFVNGLKKTKLSVAFSMHDNETAEAVQYALANPHYLESWGDVEMVKGEYSLMQPTIKPLFNTRQFQEALLKWTGNDKSYYNYLKDSWNATILNGASWNKAVRDGFFKSGVEATKPTMKSVDFNKVGAELAKIKSSDLELEIYVKTSMGDGQMAGNPWLQELPDPITRTTWDNYITVSKADAKKLGIENWHVADGGLNGSLVEVTVGNVSKVLPAYIQPGQAKGSIGVSVGYGRKKGLKEEMQVGVNAYPFYKNFNPTQPVSVKVIGGEHKFACLQLHNTLMGRGDLIKETTLKEFNNPAVDPKKTWNKRPEVSLDHKEVEATSVDLWESFDRTIGHHFKLSIDLNACTGCAACVIACHAENNVPVVGKSEIRKSRDMHWLRIDRYYSHEDTFAEDVEMKENAPDGYKKTMAELEHPSENPAVAFQPVMCQHCNHAPCETVCPVAATSHGRQGQNQMAYNRCVGTRYCANNCPYKVRRFNWFKYNENSEFDYYMNDDLGRMVLNPDVVVRSRGVMEKCSFCMQSTQAVILKAKRERRKVEVGEFNDACACSAACSSGAMVFGDVNEEKDPIVALTEDRRAYDLLEHIGVRPNVFYQAKVRNTIEE
ncbi:MAG: TAT-variant-translocated molybdopterin oxidoreductase [Flavobacteriaceae bacterium]|nr:TAT-variant-translocated molybdopterin oxidoreductase [Flavobacteriaceae bacterium]